MRQLGDDYVKKEFRLHRTAKPEFVNTFISSWEHYLKTIRSQQRNFGVTMDSKTIETMSPEQRQKLNDLREETKKAFSEK